MPTRRPNVPRASAAGAKAPADHPRATDGAEILRPRFGSHTPDAGAGKAPKPVDGAATAAGGNADAAPPAGRTDGLRSAARDAAVRAGTVRDSAARLLGGTRSRQSDEGNTPVPAKAFSGRMLALAVVLISITVLLAPTVRVYIEQRAEISALQDDIRNKQAEQQSLQTQVTRWSDPAFVRQQARDRINMVMPGETGYWVFGGDASPAAPAPKGTAMNPSNLPWVDALWQSIQRSAKD